MARKLLLLFFLVFLLACGGLVGFDFKKTAQPTPISEGKTSKESTPLNLRELEETLNVLEDPDELKRLTQQLRVLIVLKKGEGELTGKEEKSLSFAPGKESSPKSGVRGTVTKTGKRKTLLDQVLDFFVLATNIAREVSDRLRALPARLSELNFPWESRETLTTSWHFFIRLFSALIIAMVFSFLVGKYFKKAVKEPIQGETWSEWQKILQAIIKIILDIRFYLALAIFIFIWLEMVSLGKSSYFAISRIVGAIFIFKLLRALAGNICAPDNPTVRLLPVSGELANYINIWLNRLILFSIYLYIPAVLVKAFSLAPKFYSLIWSIHKIGLAVMAAIILFQWKETISGKLAGLLPSPPEEKPWQSKLFSWLRFLLSWAYLIITVYFLIVLSLSFLGYYALAKYLSFSALSSLIILALGSIFFKLLDFIFKKLFAINQIIKEKYPGLEDKVNRYVFLTEKLIKIHVGVVIGFFLLESWGINAFGALSSSDGRFFIRKMISIGLALGISLIVVNFSQYFTEKLILPRKGTDGNAIEKSRRVKTLFPVLNSIIKYGTFFIAGMIILQQLGIDPTPILAAAGILGLAVGFGAQTLVKDIITGFFIIFEGSIAVGDVITVAGTTGSVEDVGIRITKVRTFEGELKIIPNGEITQIGNLNRGWDRAIVPVGVAYEGDLEKALKVLKEVLDQYAREHSDIVLEPGEAQGIMEFGSSQINIRGVLKVRALKQWDVQREVAMMVKKAFEEQNIEIPYPKYVLFHRKARGKSPDKVE